MSMNGIIIVDKPASVTSFDVVSRLRRITHEKRIGHAGTLDPMATGVLPVFIGRATKAISLLPCQDKRYVASFRLGQTTDTGDSTGRVISQEPVHVTQDEVLKAVAGFKGETQQIPPMYSALRKNGRHLYELAREGLEVDREGRKITIYEIALIDTMPEDEYLIEVSCSKGTYIRTLCEDIGKVLGCGAVMTALRRTFAAGFEIGEAFTLEQIAALKLADRLDECIQLVESPFFILDAIEITDKQAVRFQNGGALSLSRLEGAPAQGLCRVKNGGVFIGLGAIELERQEMCVKGLFGGGIANADHLPQ